MHVEDVQDSFVGLKIELLALEPKKYDWKCKKQMGREKKYFRETSIPE